MKTTTWLSGIVLGFATLAAACGSEETETGGAPGSGGSASGNGGQEPGQGGGTGGAGGTPIEEPTCPHEGEPVLDPSGLTPCPATICGGGGHCIPTSLVIANGGQEQADQLADCDADTKCVPDILVESGGDFILATCTSIAGNEGRCTSTCIPQVAEQQDALPQDVCGEFERCVPCYDPLSGEETGACALSCDPGPTTPPMMLEKCCGGLGTCVPTSSVPPDQAGDLPPDTCSQDAGATLCAPDVFINDPDYVPTPCETEMIFGGGEPGACLPGCLITGIQGSLVGQSTCPDDWKCAPCNDPLSGDPTGACD